MREQAPICQICGQEIPGELVPFETPSGPLIWICDLCAPDCPGHVAAVQSLTRMEDAGVLQDLEVRRKPCTPTRSR